MDDIPEVVRNEETRRFEVSRDGETAFLEYRMEPGAMVVPHTVVPHAFSGHGVGGLLARTALDYARGQGLKVKPTCSFLAGYIAKHPEYQDLAHPDFRARLGIA